MRHFWKPILALGLSAALSACQSTASIDAKQRITHPDEKILAYFQKNGSYSAHPEKTAYLRKLYGQTREKHWVIQDFYLPNQQAQTNAFIVFDERGLYDWDTLPFADGPIIFYFADGSKKSALVMQKGQHIGIKEVYHPSGEVYKKQYFDAQHQISQEDYFDTNGQLFLRLTADKNSEDSFTYEAYDEQGKKHKPSPESKDLFMQIATKIDAIEAALLKKQIQVF